jgi:RimJ/RimL family protein N-acetyltransferase
MRLMRPGYYRVDIANMTEIILETARLILRTEKDGDQAVWAQHMNTPAVMDHLCGPKDPHKLEANFAKVAAAHARDGYGFMYMQHKESGVLIGNCGLKNVDNPLAPPPMQGQMEIGWSLRQDYWRQGYAFEAANAVLELAFGKFRAPRVFALTSDRNVASWRMMEKLNMQRRADLDFADPDYPPQDNPTIIYALESPL